MPDEWILSEGFNPFPTLLFPSFEKIVAPIRIRD